MPADRGRAVARPMNNTRTQHSQAFSIGVETWRIKNLTRLLCKPREVGPTSYSLYPMDTNDRPSLSLTKIPPPSISYSARSHFRFAARPIRSLRLSALECLTSFACLPATMTSADFCPLPTRIAPRRAVLHASVRDRIANRSPRIRTLTLTGQPPHLPRHLNHWASPCRAG